ncbi:helix-turn-helix transcriptional regulator [Streptoalloteichus hindustanus]|uniref:Predicted DNA-binding transcriptional regulator YafY, contains an HTH and WYL domains n=1 Tax=Streptoalloteichus hindustanus TaxID=2017 RepID=A0A1M5PKS1_STRHI|nr:WYL domain-containing protein [Streptoalloteichus hindustanus]SHH01823.1 Predicted DNA-binding transcriptional regulator YafY, contains an HTH and WYL domains [Streptoalloteichus hindustanus]
MRASRLLSILLLLQTRGRMTAQELADELEISVRTVYRDMDSLSAAGVPVYADRGRTGGYQVLQGYRTRLTGLNTDEAESLFLAGAPGPASELGLGSVLAAAQLKLLAALPPELRSRAGRIRERFHLDAPRWFNDETPARLAEVAEALWNQRPLQVRYRLWDGENEVTRRVEPLGIVLKAGTWYLVARSGENLRTYRVSRLLEMSVLEGHFERPEDFDLVAYWRSWTERFETGMYRDQAVVRLSPRGMQMLFLLGSVVSKLAKESAGPPEPDGWVEVKLPIESVQHAEVDLLRLGAEVEVLAPQELRERITDTARAMTRLYAS